MRPAHLPALAFALSNLVSPATAQQESSEASGNFGGADLNGYYYQAEVYRSSEFLVLRIWESLSGPDGPWSLTLDNTKFAYTPLGGREWLTALPEGPLVLTTESENDGTLYTTRTILSHMDNMIAVTSHATYANSLAGAERPADTARCFAAQCWSCEADVWNGGALAGGEHVEAYVAYEDRNASLWHPDRAIDLGLCPAYD